MQRLEAHIRTDPATYPPAEVMARLEYGMLLTAEGAQRREALWAEIRDEPRPG